MCDATDLGAIPSGSYDFVLSSHSLEHVANPLKALEETKRVLKDGGIFVIVLPHQSGSFDHRRSVTPLAHLVDDYRQGTGEDDLSHLEEILEKHDLSMDPLAGDLESFRRRALDNIENRCLHQHVFDTPSVVALLDHVGLQLIAAEAELPYNIIVVGQKLPAGTEKENRRFLDANADYRRSSPFARDRA